MGNTAMSQKVGYNEIYAVLCTELTQHALLPPGSMLPSENELMTRFGVSRTTIRRAVDRLEQENRVIRRAGVGTFVAGDDVLEVRKVFHFGAELRPGVDPYYSSLLLDALRHACSLVNANLIIRNREELLRSQDLDGIFLSYAETDEFPALAKISAESVPVVLINRIAPQPELAYYAVDYEEMVRQTTSRLLRNGARRIAFVGGSDSPAPYSPYWRKRGWMKAFAEHSLRCPGELHFEHLAVFDRFDDFCRFIGENEIEVLLLGYSALCVYSLVAIERVGKVLGRDLDIICFDDLSAPDSTLPGAINYVRMPLREMAAKAVAGLVRRLQKQDHTVPKELFRSQLVVSDCKYLY